MNRLLAHYGVDVQHPEVSGAEHLEMLQIRDQLARLEPTLTAEEKAAICSIRNSNASSIWPPIAVSRGFRQSAGGGTSMSSGMSRAAQSSPLRAPNR
jgi:hypothetical protein